MGSSAESDGQGSRQSGRVAGRYFAAGQSRFAPAELRFATGSVSLMIDGSGSAKIASLTEVTVDAPVAGLPRRVRLPNGGVFECDDHLALEQAWSKSAGRPSRRPRSLGMSPGKWGALIFASIAMPIALWVFYPYAADGLARSLPYSVDRALGDSVIEQMDRGLMLESEIDPERRVQIRSLFAEVAEASEIGPGRVNLLFRKGRIEAFNKNAFALPNGTIVLLDGLVALSKSDDEIAAVLAHEIGHVKHRHSVRNIARSAGLGLIVSVFLGDSASLLEELAAVGATLANLSFSREFETEADSEAAEIMRRLGRDPTALVDLLRRLSDGCGEACDDTGFLSSHPGFRDRLETVTE